MMGAVITRTKDQRFEYYARLRDFCIPHRVLCEVRRPMERRDKYGEKPVESFIRQSLKSFTDVQTKSISLGKNRRSIPGYNAISEPCARVVLND